MDRSNSLVVRAARLLPALGRLREEADDARHQAGLLQDTVPGWSPVADKLAGWGLEDEADRLELEAALKAVKVEQLLGAAVSEMPDLAQGRNMLASFHRDRHRVAERLGRKADAARHWALLQSWDTGENADYLQGAGELSLVVDPPHSEVHAFRYVEHERHLVEEDIGSLGRAPLDRVRLDHGSYLLELRAEGCTPVRYPVEIGRLEHFIGVPPREETPRVIRLPRPGELGADDVYVPPGWFRAGGDPDEPSALPAQRMWCHGFVIRRFAVTNAEFIEFLDDLVDQGRDEEALKHAPRDRTVAMEDHEAISYGRDDEGHFFVRPDAEGDAWEADWPVILVDWLGADAYCRWIAARTGLPWRLPMGLEWGKAARGVDGRLFPWGNRTDPTFACMRESHSDHPLPAPVDSYPIDTSPYGVRGMAGNVVELCGNLYEDDAHAPSGPRVGVNSLEPTHVTSSDLKCETRGGSWYNWARYCRCARRGWVAASRDRYIGLGFRLARTPPWEAEP